MNLIDTHSHIYLPEFDSDVDEVIKNAGNNSVSKIILPNIDNSSLGRMNRLVSKYPDICFPLVGLHPSSVDENYTEELNKIFKVFETGKYFGIGEIGIDLYWEKKFKAQQINAFTRQVEFALERNLPVVIHARESFDEIFTILKSFKGIIFSGIFHAFTGNIQQAKKAVSLGFKIGIGGIVTFKNAGLDRVVKEIDLNHLVLETDSPYLAPAPKRGKRNESAFIKYIAEKVADIHQTSVEKVASVTTTNACEVFNIV
ncbi:MAG: TatD family hydrolase [Bacteroidales bacterium]|nr:TatD family hydrolase [Bacteroidales bacterium]